MAKKKAKSKSLNEIRSEILAFRGRLCPDLRFELFRSYSTHDVKMVLADVTEGYRLELVDQHERVINRAPVSVVPVKACEAGGERYSRVWGYIGLSEGAEEIRLYRDDMLLVNLRIPERPTLALTRHRIEVDGKGCVKLALRYSKPSDGAFMQIAYQWREQAWRSVGIYEPAKTLSIDISQLPSGKACRLLVLYSNGMRSLGDVTSTFRRPIGGGQVRIRRPRSGSVFAPWVPVDFEGLISDPEGTELAESDHFWRLNGEIIHRGTAGSLENLAEGNYTLTLRTGDTKPKSRSASAKVSFSVKRPRQCAGIPAREWDSTGT